MLILEEYEFAKARGARIYAELVGYGMSADAYHITAPSEDGDGAFRVMSAAIESAGITHRRRRLHQRPRHLDAAGRRARNAGDQPLLRRARRQDVAVSSTKSMTGHLLGAAGGLEAGITVLAVYHQIAPPTINLDQPDDDCDLDYVPHHSRPLPIDLRAVELVRLRRHQRRAAVQAIRG